MKISKKEKTSILFFILILLSLSLVGLDKLGWLNFIKRPVAKIVNPIREKIYQINSNRQKLELTPFELAEIVKKGEFLEIENANLQTELEAFRKENQDMRKLLGAPLAPDWQFIPAKVLSVKNGIMTINQGSDLGIKENRIVVYENVLVGQVFQVNPQSSKIRLINNKDVQIKAKIIKSNIKGVVKQINNVLLLDEVLQEANLEKEQIIITSGEEGIFPPNLLIGKIDTIEKNETAVYQKATLRPFLNYSSLITVFVIK